MKSSFCCQDYFLAQWHESDQYAIMWIKQLKSFSELTLSSWTAKLLLKGATSTFVFIIIECTILIKMIIWQGFFLFNSWQFIHVSIYYLTVIKAPMQTATSLSTHEFKAVVCLIRSAKQFIILYLPKFFCNRSLGFSLRKQSVLNVFLKY